MNGSIVDHLRCQTGRARMSRALLRVGAVVVSMAATDAGADWQTGPFATACALKEVKVITLLEDHGEAGNLSSNTLGDAGLTMLRARLACYDGHVNEALALYDSILNLGPVISFRKP